MVLLRTLRIRSSDANVLVTQIPSLITASIEQEGVVILSTGHWRSVFSANICMLYHNVKSYNVHILCIIVLRVV